MLLLPLTPRTWDKCLGASPGTVDWSRELGTWPEDVCMSCLVSWSPGQPAGNTFRQARVPCSPVARTTWEAQTGGILMAPRPATHLSPPPQPTAAFHFISMKSWKT